MKYFEVTPEDNPFNSLVVDLTHRCNMKCANCYIPNRKIPDMDVGRLFPFLARLPRKTFIRLIGAEPTLRDDLPAIIREVIALGHRPSLTTNGLRLADESFLIELKQAGLKYVCLSMNGADNDDAYKALDNGRYASQKVAALENLLRHRFFVAIGTIIARGVNEHCIEGMVRLLREIAEKQDLTFNKRYLPTLRFKSIGQIGRYMEDMGYTFAELTDLVCSRLNLSRDLLEPCAAGSNTPVSYERWHSRRWSSPEHVESYVSFVETPRGPVSVRLIDWGVDDEGVVNAGNLNRGRITQDWKIAPFFENVKLNEFGY